MSKLTYVFNIPGIAHEKNCLPSADAVKEFRYNGHTAIVCADGSSACRFGREAAQAIADTLSIHLALYSQRLMEDSLFALIDEIIGVIRSQQASLCRELDAAITDLGCTLAAAVMTADGRYLACNLGDAAILGRRHFSRHNEVVLPPQTDGALTSDEDWRLCRSLRVRRGAGYNALFVGSDGLNGLLWNEEGVSSDLTDQLMENMVSDPASLQETFEEAIYDLVTDDASGAAVVDRQPGRKLFIGKDGDRISHAVNHRKQAGRYYEYLMLRDRGLSRDCAAHRVGWNQRTMRGPLRHLQLLGLD